MSKRGGVSLPGEFKEKLRREFERRKIELREKGIYSMSSFVTHILNEWFEKNPPRLEIVNHDVNIVRVRDRKLNMVADVEFKMPDIAFCPVCRSNSCIHVRFALSQPDVVEDLRKRGWRGEDYLD
ncbi:MAG: hypothetical protein ACXQTR_05655 [Candidatus Methanospirareceae archaeon]